MRNQMTNKLIYLSDGSSILFQDNKIRWVNKDGSLRVERPAYGAEELLIKKCLRLLGDIDTLDTYLM